MSKMPRLYQENKIIPATLSGCTFRGVNAQEFYKCRHDIGSFTEQGSGRVWNQAGPTSCVWVASGLPWHFTTATHGNYDVHITHNATGQACGAHMVGGRRCTASPDSQTHCSTAACNLVESVCEAFIAAGSCSGP